MGGVDRVRCHYDSLLASHYTWMLGGDVEAVAAVDRTFLEGLGLRGGALAVDLGCGPGPQTLALADLGYRQVLGVDLSRGASRRAQGAGR